MQTMRLDCVFLDRDGVINRKLPEGSFVRHPRDLELLPGSALAIARLNAHNAKVIIITNQRAIESGFLTEEGLQSIHESLRLRLAEDAGARVDAIYHCPHDPARSRCRCRKPETALFERAFLEFPSVTKAKSAMIGDSLSDVLAARAMGLSAIFVKGPSLYAKPGADRAIKLADYVVSSLHQAVDLLL